MSLTPTEPNRMPHATTAATAARVPGTKLSAVATCSTWALVLLAFLMLAGAMFTISSHPGGSIVGSTYSLLLLIAALGARRGLRSAWFASVLMLALNILVLAAAYNWIAGHHDQVTPPHIHKTSDSGDVRFAVAVIANVCIFLALLAREREFGRHLSRGPAKRL